MKKNLGLTDRIIRIMAALALSALYLTETVTGQWGVILMIIAAVMVLTALVGFCPLYRIFGFKTCKTAL